MIIFSCISRCRLAYPGPVFMCFFPRGKPFFIAGTISIHHVPELFPVNPAKIKVPGFLIPPELVIGNRHTQYVYLLRTYINEFLPELIIAEPFDFPLHAFLTVGRRFVWRTEHHDRGPPPAVDGILAHLFLSFGSAAQRKQDLKSLTLMKTFFFTNTDHSAGIRSEGRSAKWHLVHNGRSVYQPPNGADICPAKGWVIEYGRIFGPAGKQLINGLPACAAQCFRGGVQIKAMPRFVLHFGNQ